MANRKIGQAGLKLIMEFEGCRLAAYQCAAGVWTIGYGHTAGVHKGMTITQAQAEEYLKQDVAKFEKYVNNASYVPITAALTQNQFDALVSFAYNCGAGNVKKLCKGRTAAQIATAMLQYCKANGKVLAGLKRRREAEQKLFNTVVAKTYRAGNWYKATVAIPVHNGYYGDVGKYEYLSSAMKKSCQNKSGNGYIKKGNIICPTEVRTFDDGSVWFMLDKTIACMVVGTDGTTYIEET